MESTSSSSTGVTLWDGNLCTGKCHLLTVTDSGFFLGQHPGFQSVCYLETGWLHVCFYVFRIPSHWQSYNSTGRKSTWEEEHLVHVVLLKPGTYLVTGWMHVCYYVFRSSSHWQSYKSTGRKSTWEEEHLLVHVVLLKPGTCRCGQTWRSDFCSSFGSDLCIFLKLTT